MSWNQAAPAGSSLAAAAAEGAPSLANLPPELAEALASYAASGQEPPPELGQLLDAIKGVERKEEPSQEILPTPYYTVKARRAKDDTKAFINMMGSDAIGAPGDWSGASMPKHVEEAMAKLESDAEGFSEADAQAVRFPLSLSEPRQEKDKAGAPCRVYDCVLNDDIMQVTMQQSPGGRKLKQFIIELVINWVGQKYGEDEALVEGEYVIPKMKYKGVPKDGWGSKAKPEPMRVRAEPKKLVEEVASDAGGSQADEAPSFALRAEAAPRKAPIAGGGAAANGGGGKAAREGEAPSQPRARTGAQPAGRQQSVAPVQDTRPLPEAKVTLEGCPAAFALLEVSLPACAARGAVRVRSLREEVEVLAEGCRPLRVQLPFAVDGENAVAVKAAGGRSVTVRLPYTPLGEVLADAAARAPHQRGEIAFASNDLLSELE